jgi:phenylpropionate dioxygenase-like ring-hydroxylating dioxygenase large terminal subunit
MREVDDGVGAGWVPARIFGNERVYKEELRRIFGRCWLYLGHVSEIPNPGDFMLRKMGEDDYIVTRDKDGKIHAMLNACRHRGVHVCRVDRGNAEQFRCLYHGWTFANNGDLVGGPLWKNAYGDMSKSENGLLHVAQLDTHQGLIFATLDAKAPSLKEYLGGMAWYLDLIFGLNEHGVEFMGPPQRCVIPGDWKSAADNSCGDDYHLPTLHKSIAEVNAFPVSFVENMKGYHIQAAPGHSLSFSSAMTEDDPGPRFFGSPQNLVDSFNTSQISADQLHAARMSRVIVGNVFPNFTFIIVPTTDDPNQPPVAGISLKVWQPKGPDRMEIWNQFPVYKNMTQEQKERQYAVTLASFSVGGLFEMDDSEPWSMIHQTGGSVSAEVLDLKLNYRMGLPDTGIAQRLTDFPGPGVVYAPRYEEGVQRNLYKFYADMMSAPLDQWPETSFPSDEL